MSTEPKPSAKLPWKFDGRKVIETEDGEPVVIDHGMTEENALYIVHACNTLAELQKPCMWVETDLGWYDTDCGHEERIAHGLEPHEFCHNCGHKIRIQEVTEDDE